MGEGDPSPKPRTSSNLVAKLVRVRLKSHDFSYAFSRERASLRKVVVHSPEARGVRSRVRIIRACRRAGEPAGGKPFTSGRPASSRLVAAWVGPAADAAGRRPESRSGPRRWE